MTDPIPIDSTIADIPTLMQAIADEYGLEVPTVLGENHLLNRFWETAIAVSASDEPPLQWLATGNISTEFPFNFAESLSFPSEDFPFLESTEDTLKLNINLRIEVVQPAPKPSNTRGVKVTVFPVPKSPENPNGVVVKSGLNFVDTNGNPVEDDSLSTDRIPEEQWFQKQLKENEES